MTIDKAKLKALAQAVSDLEDIPEREDEHAEAVDALWLNMHCHTILALLAEIERIELISRISCNHDGFKAVLDERDQLKAENEALRKDALRYRWLRSLPDEDAQKYLGFANQDTSDQEIDEAMSDEDNP